MAPNAVPPIRYNGGMGVSGYVTDVAGRRRRIQPLLLLIGSYLSERGGRQTESDNHAQQ
ncbi:MAG: hypothetical protein WBD25_17205 [Terriglobales bacterium]